jgi:hypothetical protein
MPVYVSCVCLCVVCCVVCCVLFVSVGKDVVRALAERIGSVPGVDPKLILEEVKVEFRRRVKEAKGKKLAPEVKEENAAESRRSGRKRSVNNTQDR